VATPPDEDLAGPAAYPQWRMDSDPAWVLHQIEELLDEDLDDACFRAEACEILSQARVEQPTRRMIADSLRPLPKNAWDPGSLCEKRVQLIIEDASGTSTCAVTSRRSNGTLTI